MASKRTEKQPYNNSELSSPGVRSLVLYNDDYHTFEYVIRILMEVCAFDEVQAEQITYLVHYKGKCEVKSGDAEALKPYLEALMANDLDVEIS